MVYAVGDKCPSCGKGALILQNPSSKNQFICNECHKTHVNAYGEYRVSAYVSKIKTQSGEKVRGKTMKEIEHKINPRSQVRYIRLRNSADTKFFQIAYTREGQVKHLDCKTCGNKWDCGDDTVYGEMFELNADTLRCKTCNSEVPIC